MGIKKNVVWSDPRNESEGKCESINPQDEAPEKISKDLSELIASILVPYGSREILARFVYNAVLEQVQQYIREYDNVAAKDILRSMKGGWLLGDVKKWESDVDYSHARHAKFFSFGEEIANEFRKRTDPKELIDKIWGMPVKERNLLDNNDGLVYVSDVVKTIEKYFNTPIPEDKKDNNEEVTNEC